VATIRTRERSRDEAGPVTARTLPMDGGAGCRWLVVAAERAGLGSANRWSSPDPALGQLRLPRMATHTLGTSAGSVRAARDFTLATLHRWSVAERSDDIAIVVSELLTNAVRHALRAPGDIRPRRPVRLGLLQPGPCVLCAVAAPGRAPPVLQAPSFFAETGRGLHIICALSDRWGYTIPSDTGKVVWATFTSPLAPPRRPGSRAGPSPLGAKSETLTAMNTAAAGGPCNRSRPSELTPQDLSSGIGCRDRKRPSRSAEWTPIRKMAARQPILAQCSAIPPVPARRIGAAATSVPLAPPRPGRHALHAGLLTLNHRYVEITNQLQYGLRLFGSNPQNPTRPTASSLVTGVAAAQASLA
jgi:hypothetical protein